MSGQGSRLTVQHTVTKGDRFPIEAADNNIVLQELPKTTWHTPGLCFGFFGQGIDTEFDFTLDLIQQGGTRR